MVTGPLPILFPNTLKSKTQHPLYSKEHVACLMDENCENGVILGAIYSQDETPPFSGDETFGTKHSNADYSYYDATDKKFVTNAGNYRMEMSSTGKIIIKNSVETIGTILNSLIDQIALITHTETGSVTLPPSNAGAITAIKARITALLG